MKSNDTYTNLVYMKMELKLLKSFIAVATHKNFSLAAQELNTVQPAISRHISELEEELGVSLFWRNTRGVKITAAGLSLLSDAKEILNKQDSAIKNAVRAAKGEIGTIRIGHIGSASFTFLPKLIRKYTSIYPNVEIFLFEMSVQEQIEAFKANKIDIGISRKLPQNMEKVLTAKTLYIDTLFAVVPETSKHLIKEKIKLNELSNEKFILFNRNEAPVLFDHILSECSKNNFIPDIANQPRSMQTVLTEIASGLGVSVVPGCIRKLYAQGCKFIPIKGYKPAMTTELHYMDNPTMPTIQAFVDLTLQSLPEIQSEI